MSSSENELQLKIAKAKQEYREYAESQKGFCFPKVDITLEENNDFVDVHMEVEFNGTHFHFESLKLEVEEDVYKYLDSDRIVREKFADGKARTREQSKDRAEALSERFQKRSKKGEGKAPNLYSGFAVLDKETDSFIGLGIAGGGTDPGTSEIAFLNRASTWSHMPEAVVQAYDMSSSLKPKSYKGIATAEIGTLLQYGAYLKDRKHQVNGHDLKAMVMTARLDNPGSWKAAAKSGMEVYAVDSNPNYGPELRYQISKTI